MHIGAIYPQTELHGDPQALNAIGRAMEAAGYDYLLMFDHVAGAVHEGRDPPMLGPYTEKHPFHDPFVAFGYLAGITSRIGFATGVLVLPQRQTFSPLAGRRGHACRGQDDGPRLHRAPATHRSLRRDTAAAALAPINRRRARKRSARAVKNSAPASSRAAISHDWQ
jgi:Luciferase-like monooxygenase